MDAIKNAKELDEALSALNNYFEDMKNNVIVMHILDGNSAEKFNLMDNIFKFEPVVNMFCTKYKVQYAAFLAKQRKG